MNDCKIDRANIPNEVWNEIVKIMEQYSTAIILDNHFIGSGTFISWENNFGILTAEHVINNPKSKELKCRFGINSKQRMQLTVASYRHHLEFENKYLRGITLGKRRSNKFGPDMAVIVLPVSSQLSTIRAIKSFWPLTTKTKEKMEIALEDGGFTVIAGHVGEEQTVSMGRTVLARSCHVPGMAAFCKQTNYFEKNGKDYVEVGSDKGPGSEAPDSYGGVSGGGVWRIRLVVSTAGSGINISPVPYLVGVMFWQSREKNGRRTLRGHGPKTIYEILLPQLLKS